MGVDHDRTWQVRWGVVARADAGALSDLVRDFSAGGRGASPEIWRVITGDDGWCAALTGEAGAPNHRLPQRLSEVLGQRVYLVDFDRHRPTVEWFEGATSELLVDGGDDEVDPAALDAAIAGGELDELDWTDEVALTAPRSFLRERGIPVPVSGPLVEPDPGERR